MDENDQVVEERDCGENLVVNNGLNILARLLTGDFALQLNRMQLGTGTGTPSKTDIALFTPVGSPLVEDFATAISSGVTMDRTWGLNDPSATETYVITEFGCLSGTTLYNHVTFDGITKAPNRKLRLKLDLIFE